MADDTTTNSNGDTVTDSSKGAIIPTADGGVTLDNGSENRDPIPSPVENRDSVRNSDDAGMATDATAGEVLDYEALAKSGWQVGNFDAGTGAGGDVLSNLAYPSAKAVRAERAALAQNQGKETLIGGAEYDDSSVKEKNDERARVLADGKEAEDDKDEESKDESELTPQEKRARTNRLKKEREAEEKRAAEEAEAKRKEEERTKLSPTTGTEGSVLPLGDPAGPALGDTSK